MTKKYKNPPISEVVCEFQFGQDSSWDYAIPGLVYEKVQTTFPIRSQATRVTMGISAYQEAIAPQIGTMPLMRFSTEDEKVLMQVGIHLLSIHRLKPYSSWEEFFPFIEDAFKSYCEIADPKSIHRIGLRYVNTIQITGEDIDLEDYFEFRPYVSSNLPRTVGPFTTAVQFPFEESRDVLNLQLASLAGISSDIVDIILDLDYFLVQSNKVEPNGVPQWLDNAHKHIGDIFDASITDQLKQIFDE
jgi:uncharacterized protein (TIGR04255 family)